MSGPNQDVRATPNSPRGPPPGRATTVPRNCRAETATVNIVGQATPNTFHLRNQCSHRSHWLAGIRRALVVRASRLGQRTRTQPDGRAGDRRRLGTLIRRIGVGPDIVTGHDFRSYSKAIATALVSGLITASARVKDIGLALPPTAYFARFALNFPSAAMVTASHNENGWTAVKMGAQRPLTFGRRR